MNLNSLKQTQDTSNTTANAYNVNSLVNRAFELRFSGVLDTKTRIMKGNTDDYTQQQRIKKS